MKLSLDGCKLLLIHVVLALVATAMVLPFTWMVLASLKRLQEIGLDSWIPTVFQWENHRDVFTMKGVQFGRWYWNSILVAAWVTFLQVFTSSLAAFSFSRLKWKGRDLVFLLYLATMMLPSLVMMIPNYQNMIYLGLVNTLQGLILPSAFSAFGTFLIRQFMMNIPSSLDEAAEIDGRDGRDHFVDRAGRISRERTVEQRIHFVFAEGFIVLIERRNVIGRVARHGEDLTRLAQLHNDRAAPGVLALLVPADAVFAQVEDDLLERLLGHGLQGDIDRQLHVVAGHGLGHVIAVQDLAGRGDRRLFQAARAVQVLLKRLLHAGFTDECIHGVALFTVFITVPFSTTTPGTASSMTAARDSASTSSASV